MTTTHKLSPREQQATARVQDGWQCPECYGVQINTRRVSIGDPRVIGFECHECGCQFGSRQ